MGRPEKIIEEAVSELVAVNRFVFLLMPGFSALELGSGIDSLAAANDTLGKTFFHWKTVSETGDSIVSSSGLNVAVDSPLRISSEVIASSFAVPSIHKNTANPERLWLGCGALRDKASGFALWEAAHSFSPASASPPKDASAHTGA